MLCGGVLACEPGPPIPGKGDTAAAEALLDTGQSDLLTGGDPCSPSVPAETQTVTVGSTLPDPGQYLLCEGVPVTATADDTVLFLSPYSSAQLSGARTVVFAQGGSSVNAAGPEAVVVAEEDALVTVLSPDATVVRCPRVAWLASDAARACSAR